MFAADEVSLNVGFDVALVRLRRLIDRGALHGVSEAAYEGILVRIGPFGGNQGISKLVWVRVLEPVVRGSTATVPMRWEAAGVAGELFPVLDADLRLTSEGDDQSRLTLAGSYRPPLGKAGELLDRAILGHVAAATIRSFLDDVAVAIVDPEQVRQPSRDTPVLYRPVIEPEL